MQEIWKDIRGYEGKYKISTYGNVYSYKRKIYISQSKGANGYFKVNLHKNSSTKTFSVHRLVAETFISNPNNLPEINHKSGNKTNNRVTNLEWCTHNENMEHAFYWGLAKKCEEKPQLSKQKKAFKLSASQVFAIRSEYKKGVRGKGYKSLAKKYKVSDTEIKQIIAKKIWQGI